MIYYSLYNKLYNIIIKHIIKKSNQSIMFILEHQIINPTIFILSLLLTMMILHLSLIILKSICRNNLIIQKN